MWLMLFGLFTHAVFDAWFDQLGEHTNDSCAMPTLRRPVSATFAQFALRTLVDLFTRAGVRAFCSFLSSPCIWPFGGA